MPTPRARQFNEEGYTVFRGLLTSAEAAFYRARLQELCGFPDADAHTRQGSWALPDGVTKLRDLWPLIEHPGILAAMHEILGNDVRYVQHSDLRVHTGIVSWHRDATDPQYRVGWGWDERRPPYRVARVALYLQSHAESGSSLGVVPGSHRRETPFMRHEISLHNMISRITGRICPLRPLSFSPIWIPTEPGDCIVFSMRLLHSAGPICGPKYSMFLGYGPDDEHSRNHQRHLLRDRTDLHYEDMPEGLRKRLGKSGLLLSAP